jgi:hypothetical protein
MKREKFVFIRSYQRRQGIDYPLVVLWSCGAYELDKAKLQYPENTVVVCAKGFDAAKVLARQYFHTR